MALKTLPELQNEIDHAVHTNGPQGKTRAAGLNTVLKSLATQLINQQQETAQALADQGDLLGKDNTWTGTNYFSKGLRFYGGNGFDEYGQLYVNQLVIGNKYSWRNQSFTLAKDSALMWKPTDYTQESGAPDVGLARADVGLLEVNTGTPGHPATLTTLDVVALAAPSTLNSVTKLAEALVHKADLDAAGRVPSSQLPSYVDDILEASSFAALPASGEASKVYVTLDTNKQYRWAGTAYALLSDSGLTTTIKAGLEAATNPSISNAFATLADLVVGNDAKATLITAGHQRTPYFGTGTVSNTNEDGLKKALAAAQPGDTVQQLSFARIAAPYRMGEQLKIPAGVNYDTGGFDIDATGYCDGIILVGGTGVIHGDNSTISHNVNGSWGIGWYGGGTLDYRIYDLNIRTAVDGREYFANPFAIYLPECRVYHTGSIISTSPVAIHTHNIAGGAGNQYEHVGTVTGLGTGALFGVGPNGKIIQRGDVIVAENATAGAIHAGANLTLQGGILDLRNAQLNAGFKLDSAGTLTLIDVTVLGDQMPALLNDANQGSGATVHLYGDTVLPNSFWPTGITVVDHRPVNTSGGSGKADLVNGKVPAIQLPVDAQGNTSPIYLNGQDLLDIKHDDTLVFNAAAGLFGVNMAPDLAAAPDYQVATSSSIRRYVDEKTASTAVQCIMSVVGGSTQRVLNASSAPMVQLKSVSADSTPGMASTSDSAIVIPKTGTYFVRGFIDIQNADPGARYELSTRINGQRNARCLVSSGVGASDSRAEITLAGYVTLNAGDKVTMLIYSQDGDFYINTDASYPDLWASLMVHSR